MITENRAEKHRKNDHQKLVIAVRKFLKTESDPGAYEKLYHYVKDNLLSSMLEDLSLVIFQERKNYKSHLSKNK